MRAQVVPRTMESSTMTTRLPSHGGGNGVQLDAHGVLPLLLSRLDECAADVLVLDEADAVGNPAGAAVADGGIQPGIRHADDHIRLNRMVKREEAARPDARLVDAAAVNDGIGPREINELEDAHAVVARAGHLIANESTSSLTTTTSPASISRTNVAPMASSAQLSDANTTSSPILPMHSGRKPCGSRQAISLRRTHDDERIRALDDLHRIHKPPVQSNRTSGAPA